MTIASDCMAEFRDQNLDAIGLLEQVSDLVVGVDRWANANNRDQY